MSHPHSRAARRACARLRPTRKSQPRDFTFRQKKWRYIFWRSNKLIRARQIGKIWPHREWELLMDDIEPVGDGDPQRS